MWWCVYVIIAAPGETTKKFVFETKNEKEAFEEKDKLEKQCERPPHSIYVWLQGPFESKDKAEQDKIKIALR